MKNFQTQAVSLKSNENDFLTFFRRYAIKASKNLFLRLSRSIGSLMFVFIFSNTLLVEETKAQCPPGYSTTTLAMTVYGCDYFIDFCVICPPICLDPIDVYIRGISPQDPYCTANLSDVLEEIEKLLYDENFLNILCPNSFPPCELGKWKYSTVRRPA